MGKYVYNVKWYNLKPFESLLPCGCNYCIEHRPTYTVQTKTTANAKTGYKPKITWISIQCELCKSISCHDVSNMDIYEDDLKI